MTLAQFRTALRARCPGLKESVASNTVLDLELNNGAKDIAAYCVCLPTNKKFNVVANQSEYHLSVVIGNYLVMDKPGLWWNSGTATTTKWEKLDCETLASLDANYPTWRDLSSGSPERYTIDGDIIIISPPPDTALTEGFKLYYGAESVDMTEEGHYPFSGSTTEYTHLSIFDEAILLYAKSKLMPELNKLNDENLTHQKYLAEREEKRKLFKRRPDISAVAQMNYK